MKKKQSVLINWRESLMFTPQNIGNLEQYKMQCQQNS